MFSHVFAIDPGDKRNGFCYFKYDSESRKADLKIMKILDPDELTDMLKVIWGISQNYDTDSKPEIRLVAENFRVDTKVRNAKFQWNELHVIRTLGKLELLAALLEVRLYLQEPSVLGIGRKWVPFKVNAGHIRDDHSAFIHGVHHMMNVMQWFPTTDSVTMFGQEPL